MGLFSNFFKRKPKQREMTRAEYEQLVAKRDLIDVVSEYFQQGTFSAKQALIQKHPELLTDTADSLVGEMIAAMKQRGLPPQAIEMLEVHHSLLKQSRAVGIERAFRDEIPEPLRPLFDAMESLPGDQLSEFSKIFAESRSIGEIQLALDSKPALRRAVEELLEKKFGRKVNIYEAIGNAMGGVMATASMSSAPDEFREAYGQAVEASGQYRHTGQVEVLSRAVDVWLQILNDDRFKSESVSFRVSVLNQAGQDLHSRYSAQGNPTDLDGAISCLRQALDVTPVDSPDRSWLLNNLGSCLNLRHKHTGDLSDLESAISLCSEAVELSSEHSPDRPYNLSNLANVLESRYALLGDVTDLDRAIHLAQQGLDLTPPESPERAGRLTNLGSRLQERSKRTGDISYLERALECYRQSVELTPQVSPWRRVFMSNLAAGLYLLYQETGNLEYQDQAMKIWQEALEITPLGPERVSFLSNLAGGLRDRFLRTQNEDDLVQATKYIETAMEEIPQTSPDRIKLLITQGNILYAQNISPNSKTGWERLTKTFQEACELGLKVNLGSALTSSFDWAIYGLQRREWDEALQALSYGLRAGEQLFQTQLLRSSKEAWLRDAQRLSPLAAFAFAKNGDLVSAVEVLENGRARLLADALERDRTELERLPLLGHTDVYEQYRNAAERIEQLEKAELRQELSENNDKPAEHRLARTRLDASILAVQGVPGYENFFRPADFDFIQQCLSSSSVGHRTTAGVYLLATDFGGLALIVHPGGVHPVWLDFAERHLQRLLVKREGDKVVGGYLAGQLLGGQLQQTLTDMLPTIGTEIIEPIIVALKGLYPDLSPGERPALILIPTGLLSLLPLHAASYRLEGKEHTLLDDFSVSYAPSARALGRCRESVSSLPGNPPTLLGVGNPLPLPKDIRSLAYARIEVEEIATRFGSRAKTFYASQAKRDEVQKELATATYLHFSCHGQFNSKRPLASGLMLSKGEQLDLSYLLTMPELRAARLAVLSACQTAITDFNHLPEEAIGLPSGFLQAGVPGVIGSLWAVDDLSTALLMIKFYEYHLGGEMATSNNSMLPAEALRRAQIWLRSLTNAELSEIFKTFKQRAPDAPKQSRISYALAKDKFREYTLQKPDERPFSHPYYWAGFAFYGA